MTTTTGTSYGVTKIADLFPSIRKIKNKSLREKVAAVWSEAITTGCGGKERVQPLDIDIPMRAKLDQYRAERLLETFADTEEIAEG